MCAVVSGPILTPAMAFEDRIAACNNADLGRYVPWRFRESTAGHVRRDRVDRLVGLQTGFARAGSGIALILDIADAAAANAALAATAAALAAAGEVRALTGERFPVPLAPPLGTGLLVDRAAVMWLGVQPLGVHLTGFCRDEQGTWIWVARRSRHKPTYPGMLDNTVAGGQPHGIGLDENMAKECAEEAAIPSGIASQARRTGLVSYVREEPGGLKPEVLHCYDLELPWDFEPRPADGEVEGFERMHARDVIELVRDTERFKPNCNLVLLDFFLRHGLLDDQLPPARRDALRRALRAPMP